MYFLTTIIDNKKQYLVETSEEDKKRGFDVSLEEEEPNGKPPNNSIYWVNVDDANLELTRIKAVSPEQWNDRVNVSTNKVHAVLSGQVNNYFGKVS